MLSSNAIIPKPGQNVNTFSWNRPNLYRDMTKNKLF